MIDSNELRPAATYGHRKVAYFHKKILSLRVAIYKVLKKMRGLGFTFDLTVIADI